MTLFASLLIAGVTVTLPMEARVAGTEIELGEIAEITGADADEVRRVQAIELGYAPAPGYSRVLRVEAIERALASKAPDVRFVLRGHSVLRVWPEVNEVAAEDITEAARLELGRVFGREDSSFVLRKPLARVLVPAGGAAPRVVARLDGAPPASGSITVPVDILVDGARYRTVWTSWEVDLWRTLPVLVRDVRSGEVLTRGAFTAQRVRLARGDGRDVLGAEQLVGTVAARDLKAGATVTATDVHRPSLVMLGDGITLRVRNGNVEARVSAVALEAGALGDRIRVRTNESKQELTARVVSRDLVEIVLGG